jgi:hypothetical protein
MRIRRNGIAPGRHSGGVFAMPVTRNFYVSHQWLRELKRRGARTFVGVYFRVPDGQVVEVGRYGRPHQTMTAAKAAAMFMGDGNRDGWEVIIPRRIAATEIHRVRTLPQVIGWRFYPEAKGKRPFCPCRYCTRGEYGAARLRARFTAG